MARRSGGCPGAGALANKGLGGMKQQNLDAAIKSVPRLTFPFEGMVTLEGLTPQQLTGLRFLASQEDKKTGEAPVWKVTVSGNVAVVTHLRRRAFYEDKQEDKRCSDLVGRLTFKHNRCTYKPETNEQRRGVLAIIREQNRLADKYSERATWEYTEHNGVFHIVRVYPKAKAEAA